MQQWQNKSPLVDVTKCQETSTQSSQIQEDSDLQDDRFSFRLHQDYIFFATQNYKLFDKF